MSEEGELGTNYQKIAERSQEAWNKSVKLQEVVERTKTCRVVHAAESKKSAEAMNNVA